MREGVLEFIDKFRRVILEDHESIRQKKLGQLISD